MIVTVDEVKTHLRIQHDEEDDYIESLIKQAQTAAEDYCRVSFEKPGEDGNVPEAPEPVRLAVILMTSFYYENRDIPDMTTYKATRMPLTVCCIRTAIRKRCSEEAMTCARL